MPLGGVVSLERRPPPSSASRLTTSSSALRLLSHEVRRYCRGAMCAHAPTITSRSSACRYRSHTESSAPSGPENVQFPQKAFGRWPCSAWHSVCEPVVTGAAHLTVRVHGGQWWLAERNVLASCFGRAGRVASGHFCPCLSIRSKQHCTGSAI